MKTSNDSRRARARPRQPTGSHLKHHVLAAALCAVVALGDPAHAQAQAWPQGPVRVVVPYDPGSTPDLAARIIGEKLTTQLHQSFVVDNKSGAAGNIGADAVAKAAADGQTIGVSIAGPLGVNQLLFKKMPYDVSRDLDLVTVAVSQPSVLVVGSKQMSVTTARELGALMKHSKHLSFSSIGAGSISHLAMAALVAQEGADVVHVPYRGSTAAVTALLTGEVDMALLPAAAVMPHVKAGKLKALAVASPERSPSLPDLPTLAESGLPDIKADAWIGFIAPAKTAPSTLAALHDQVVKAIADPGVVQKLRLQYMDPVGNSSAEFQKLVASDVSRWKPVIEKHKINMD